MPSPITIKEEDASDPLTGQAAGPGLTGAISFATPTSYNPDLRGSSINIVACDNP
jgi:hypothetical protein